MKWKTYTTYVDSETGETIVLTAEYEVFKTIKKGSWWSRTMKAQIKEIIKLCRKRQYKQQSLWNN